MHYTVLLSHETDPDVVVATVPTLGVVTQGATIAAALAAAHDAVALDIEGRLEDGQTVPREMPERLLIATVGVDAPLVSQIEAASAVRR